MVCLSEDYAVVMVKMGYEERVGGWQQTLHWRVQPNPDGAGYLITDAAFDEEKLLTLNSAACAVELCAIMATDLRMAKHSIALSTIDAVLAMEIGEAERAGLRGIGREGKPCSYVIMTSTIDGMYMVCATVEEYLTPPILNLYYPRNAVAVADIFLTDNEFAETGRLYRR